MPRRTYAIVANWFPLVLIIGIALFFRFYKLFSPKAALIGVFLYACSLPLVFIDRWIVPTQPTILWSVWYLYALFITLKGDKKGLVLFGILAGLIWHIHVALLHLLLLVPVSIFFAKIKYERKYIFWAVGFFVFLTLPFWLFEIRYGFQQIAGLVASIGQDRNGIKGVERFFLAVDGASIGFAKFITYKWKAPYFVVYFFLSLPLIFLVKK